MEFLKKQYKLTELSMKELSTSFQTKDKEVIEAYEKVNEKLKDLSSHRKTSVAQTCYFSLLLAEKYLKQKENEIEENQKQIHNIEELNRAIDKNLKEVADF